MRDNPFHNAAQFLTGGIPDQVALGDARWLTVALYWALLLGALAVASINWRRDPSQRTPRHAAIFVMRIFAATMWYLGTLWKLPLPVSGGFKFWLDQTVMFSSFQWHADAMRLFADAIAVSQPLVYLAEIFFTVSLMLGLMVRVSGVLAALFTLNLLVGLYNDPTEWVWTYAGIIVSHLMFAATDAGRCLGIDNLVARGDIRLRAGGRALRWALSAA